MSKFLLLSFILVLTIILVFMANNLVNIKKRENYEKEHFDEIKNKGEIHAVNYQDVLNRIGRALPTSEIEVMFNRAKNPWNMKIETFQAIRIIGAAAGVLLILICSAFWAIPYGQIPGLTVGLLSWFYPIYYYKSIGKEREEEWNKTYEFIWVLKNNLALHDSKQALLDTKIYIEEHAPQNKEIVQGFQDMYDHFSYQGIDPYIIQYYPFAVPKEIAQISYNIYSTGVDGEDQLNQLRSFTINAQDKSTIQLLSGVSGKATAFSLPFLLVTLIICLLVPMLVQFLQFM